MAESEFLSFDGTLSADICSSEPCDHGEWNRQHGADFPVCHSGIPSRRDADGLRHKCKEEFMTDLASLAFDRDQWGRLTLKLDNGRVHVGVEPVRCFPLTDPSRVIALLDSEGHEILTLPELSSLNPEARQFLEAELASRDFVPVIQRVISASHPHPPCRWSVVTDKGQTSFQLESEDDIRRLGPHRILIADSNGIRYLIADMRALDASSKRIVQRLV